MTKPTIHELEKILDEPDCPIEVLPNGEVRAVSEYEQSYMKRFHDLEDHFVVLREENAKLLKENQEFDLSEKYPLEYLIALVTGCLETPSKSGGPDHSCGLN